MLNILFADDDALLLNKMSNIIDWEQNGYNVVGRAMDGKACLDIIKKQKVDILFLDIHMPVIDGLQVCRTLKEENVSIEIIILSNYDDFDFVRGAMHLGAFDYLLKHQINEEIILGKLNELKRRIETAKVNENQLTHYKGVAKQKFIRDIIVSGTAPVEAYSQFEEFTAGSYVLSILQIINFELHLHFNSSLNKEKTEQTIISIGTNLNQTAGTGIVVPIDYGQYAVFFSFRNKVSSKGITEKTGMYMRLLASNIQKLLGFKTELVSSQIFYSFNMLPDIYDTIHHTMKYPILCKHKSLDLLYEKEFITALSLLDYKKLENLLSKIYHEFANPYGELPQQIIRQLLSIGIRYQTDKKMPLIKDVDGTFCKKIKSIKSGWDVVEFLGEYFRRIVYSNTEAGSVNYSVYVKKALFEINSRYASDISLSLLADEFNISPSYLSRIFKKETGDSFINCLISHRIKIAKSLMENTDLPLSQIAEQTGFRNYNYFLRCYKQRMGSTAATDMLKYKEHK